MLKFIPFIPYLMLPLAGIQIHLMLKFIRGKGKYYRSNERHSNTSHVKVYPTHFASLQFLNPIQIHLMLKFIDKRYDGIGNHK